PLRETQCTRQANLPCGSDMPFTVSVRAAFFSRSGANQTPPYHLRTASRALLSLNLNGSRLSGLIGGLACSYGTSALDPQNSQRCATRSAGKTDIALQLWH